MSKRLLFVPVVLAIVLAAVVAGAALAQTPTPPTGQSAAPNSAAPAQGTNPVPRGKGFGFGFGFGVKDWSSFDATAKALNMTPEQLFEQLHNGKTLSEIAQAQGVDLAAVQKAEQDARLQTMKDRISQAVKDGRITQAQADWMLQGLQNGWGFGRGMAGPGMFEGGRGHARGFFGKGAGGTNNNSGTAQPRPTF